MRNSLLAAVAAFALAAPVAVQAQQSPGSSQQLSMPVAPPGLGERITSGVQTLEPAYPAPAPLAIAPDQLNAGQIRQIQQALRAQGYPLRRVDGVYGPETAAAVQTFQQRNNIAGAPGQLDAQTLSALGIAPGSPSTAVAGRGMRRGGVPSAGLTPGRVPGGPAQGSGIGMGTGAGIPGSYGGTMNPPSTPSLDAPGNNGSYPESSIGTPNVTRPPGALSR